MAAAQQKGNGKGKGATGKGKGKQQSTNYSPQDQLWTLNGKIVWDPAGWFAVARKADSMNKLILYDQHRNEVDVEEWLTGQQDKGSAAPIACPDQPADAPKVILTDQKRLANLKAQAASIATEIANCVKSALEEGDPENISAIHSGFIQAQTANAQAINEMTTKIAATPPTEETNAEMKKRLHKTMQEWSIATKAFESKTALNNELHRQAKELQAKIRQSDVELAEAVVHEAHMRKEYDDSHAQFPGGHAKLLPQQCLTPLTFDTDGVHRVSKLLTIAEEHRTKFTNADEWQNNTLLIFRQELEIDTAISELFASHCRQETR